MGRRLAIAALFFTLLVSTQARKSEAQVTGQFATHPIDLRYSIQEHVQEHNVPASRDTSFIDNTIIYTDKYHATISTDDYHFEIAILDYNGPGLHQGFGPDIGDRIIMNVTQTGLAMPRFSAELYFEPGELMVKRKVQEGGNSSNALLQDASVKFALDQLHNYIESTKKGNVREF